MKIQYNLMSSGIILIDIPIDLDLYILSVGYDTIGLMSIGKDKDGNKVVLEIPHFKKYKILTKYYWFVKNVDDTNKQLIIIPINVVSRGRLYISHRLSSNITKEQYQDIVKNQFHYDFRSSYVYYLCENPIPKTLTFVRNKKEAEINVKYLKLRA